MVMNKNRRTVRHVCHFCPQWFQLEAACRAHELFSHIFLTPICNTGIAEQQLIKRQVAFTRDMHERHMAKRKPTRYNSNLTNFTGAWKIFD